MGEMEKQGKEQAGGTGFWLDPTYWCFLTQIIRLSFGHFPVIAAMPGGKDNQGASITS